MHQVHEHARNAAQPIGPASRRARAAQEMTDTRWPGVAAPFPDGGAGM